MKPLCPCLPEHVRVTTFATATGARLLLLVVGPGLVASLVEAVAFDLERPTRAGQLGAHSLEQASKWSILGPHQSGAKLIAGIVATSGSKEIWPS